MRHLTQVVASKDGADEIVRGRKRQRRKAPKTRTGCTTCKIRRVKCDEGKPYCKKCTSTGRHCDGYLQTAIATADASLSPLEPEQVQIQIPQPETSSIDELATSPPTAAVANVLRLPHDDLNHAFPPLNHVPGNHPISSSLGRAFDYFLHHSSSDLTGPPHIQAWQSYILSISVRSPAIQHAVAALSELHERYSFPGVYRLNNERDGLRQYSLSAKRVSALITTLQAKTDDRADIEEEMLVACAIFISIEILFGDIKTAIRHLKSGISLVQGFLAKRSASISNLQAPQESSTSHIDSGLDTSTTSLCSFLDGHLLDLVGFFARLDLQMMSLLPPDQYTTSADVNKQILHAAASPYQSIPCSVPTQLHHIVSEALHWIRHDAYQLKYHHPIPSALHEVQLRLNAHLLAWYNISSYRDDDRLSTEPGTADLLLTYHLTLLKVHAALSSNESVFQDKACMDSFREILKYADLIIQGRKPERPATRQLSLETGTIEAVYYLAVKCRDATLRHRAVGLLRCVGREGVWDGVAMAVVAEYVVALEEGGSPMRTDHFVSTDSLSIGNDLDMMAPIDYNNGQIPSEHWRYSGNLQLTATRDRLVSEIAFTVDRDSRTVKIECGWFDGVEKTWEHEVKVLPW